MKVYFELPLVQHFIEGISIIIIWFEFLSNELCAELLVEQYDYDSRKRIVY